MDTSTTDAALSGRVTAIRVFNRFYTARMGLLRRRHLDGDFSLTEARILYEIGSNPRLTASTLRNTLQLDAGYISRVLAILTKRKLIRQIASKHDAREKLLTLSATGQIALSQLDQQSELQIQHLLASIPPHQQSALVDSLATARTILQNSSETESSAQGSTIPAVRIVRLTQATSDAYKLLQEYYEAVHVVQRDTPQAIEKIILSPASGIWIAYLADEAVGCVLLRKHSSIPRSGECKRLYVQPSARGHHIADKLMDAIENFARSKRLNWIYLDSYGDLKAAISLYRRRGYTECERYNDNPQATIFLRKHLKSR